MKNSILYQKYRPQTFSELIGRKDLSRILVNEVISKNIGNAYIFFGSKGTGKTSVARIFSKAINCLNLGRNGDPCNSCSNCKSVNNFSFMDLLEIDAASNRSIEDIRDLKNKVQFAPTVSKYKIYIIDEVHMLTKDAFNALLKTLEEPPENVIFIFATTEINKVPETIISRCQRFDFLKASYKDLMDQLNKVIKLEKIKINDEIKDLIITISEGSFRDTMTNLQKILSIYNENLEYKDVVKILNFPDMEFLKIIWNYLFEGNLNAILNEFERNTIDVVSFIKNSLDFIKKILVNRTLGKQYYKIDNTFPESISTDKILRIVNILIKTLDDIRISSSDIMCLEIAFIFIMKEFDISNKENISPTSSIINPIKSKSVEVKVNINKTLSVNEDSFISDKLKDSWPEIIEQTKSFNHHMSAFLAKSNFSFEDNIFIIQVPFPFYRDMLVEPKSKEYLSGIINNLIGEYIVVDCIVDKNIEPFLINSKSNNINEDDIKELFDVDSSL